MDFLNNIKIIAHRGASFDAPENTLASVNLAWEQQISHVEIDVKLTKDNVIAVFHDDTTERYNGEKKLFNTYTFEDVSNIDVGIFKGTSWKNEPIPTLEQVLNTIPKNGTLVVELKDGPEMIVPLEALFQTHQKIWHQLEFIAFNYHTICAAKQAFPTNKCLWLLDLDYDEETAKNVPSTTEIIRKVKQHHLDGIDVFAGTLANQSFFETMQQENLMVYLWTINDIKHAKQYLPFQPNGITTDKPKWMLEQLKK